MRAPPRARSDLRPTAVPTRRCGRLACPAPFQLAGELNESNCALTVYVLKAMAAIADAPKGRHQLQQMALLDVKALAESSELLVQKSARIALERIEWKP